MSDDEVRFSLKLLINKEKTKVLFAHVDSAFADILLSFLTVPLGAIVRLLKTRYGEQAPHIGCLNSLYNGLQNLENDCFCNKAGKQMLLDPRSPRRDEYQKLKLNLFDTRPAKYFTCQCTLLTITIDYDSFICPSCKNLMNKELEVRGSTENHDGEVFTKQEVSFLIADDLRMVPNMTGSIMESLNNLGITDVDGAEFHTKTVGFSEIMDLLKGSLFSPTPLTDIFLPEIPSLRTSKSQPSPLQMRTEGPCYFKNMKIKATIQKSSNRFLFAQAEEDFANFLLGFLAIPLGQVFSMKASLGSIDNLYQSVSTFDGKCLKAHDTKDILLKPKLYFRCSSKHPFSLSREPPPELFYHKTQTNGIYYLSNSSDGSWDSCNLWDFRDPRVKDSYVKGSTMFMVTDDLTVTPLCLLSSLSLINGLGIPLSDIVEVDINIGPKEGLSILKASLTSSSSALTDALMLNPASWKLMRFI